MGRRAFQFIGGVAGDFRPGYAGRSFMSQAIATCESLCSTFDAFGSALGYVKEKNRTKQTLHQIAALMHELDEKERETREMLRIEVEEVKKRLQLSFLMQKAEAEAECEKWREYVRLQTEKFGAEHEAWEAKEQMQREIRKSLYERLERLQEQVLLFSSRIERRYTEDLMERFRLTMRQYKDMVEISTNGEGA